MRYLSSVGMVEEIAVDTFAATNVTHVLANPGQVAGVKFLLVSLRRVVLFHHPRVFFGSFLVSLVPKCRSMANTLPLFFADDIS